MRPRALPLTALAVVLLVSIAGGCGQRDQARVVRTPTEQARNPTSTPTAVPQPSATAAPSASPSPTPGPEFRRPLDRGTAAVLAYDIAFAAIVDDTPEVKRCWRMAVARVDCLMADYTDDGPSYQVLAIARRGDRFVGAWYDAPANGDEGPYTKANTTSLGPSDNKLATLAHLYNEFAYDYEPDRLAHDQEGYGRPRLKNLLHEQCALQPKLRCSSARKPHWRDG